MPSCRDYREFCRLLEARNETALLVLRIQHNFMSSNEVDPFTGGYLPQDLDIFLQRLAFCASENVAKDRLARIIRHCETALRQLLETPNEKLIREHALLPLQAVREADSVTLAWLNSKPGSTIRQKISASRSLMAPRRRWSMDTSENRLLKKFLLSLVSYMEMRALNETTQKELEHWRYISARWMRQSEVQEIGPWQNTVPNNILLSHKHYRRIWDAWNWLRELDQLIAHDFARLPALLLESLFWRVAAMLFQDDSCRLLQVKVKSSFNNLDTTIIDQKGQDKLIRGRQLTNNGWKPIQVELKNDTFTLEIDKEPVISGAKQENGVIIRINGQEYPCLSEQDFLRLFPLSPAKENRKTARGSVGVIDLSRMQPWFALDKGIPEKLPFRLLAQLTENASRLVNLGKAKAFTLEKENPPVSFFDLFEREMPAAWLNAAAQFFFEHLRAYFWGELGIKSLIAIIPDNLNEFQLSLFQKYLRIYFPASRTLPASVAAAFSYEHRKGTIPASQEHVLIVVFNIVGDKLILTPLEGKREDSLASRLPAYSGFIWGRHPSHEIPYPEGLAKNILADNGISLPFMPFSAETLANLAGQISIFPKVDNEYKEPVDLPEELADTIEEQLRLAPDAFGELKKIVQAIAGNKKMALYAINASDIHIKTPGVKLEYSGNPVTGGALYGQWKSLAPDIILWRDHLPDLYMRVSSSLKPIPLAHNLTIQPILGKKIHISLPEEIRQIKLPGNKAVCQFPLQREEFGAKIRYIGQLESRKYLPVDHDWLAKLELSYEYGAENPYELSIIPQEKGMPEKLLVRWLPLSELRRESPSPQFPPEDDWQSLRSFEGKKGTVDAVREILEMFEEVHKIRIFLDDDSEESCNRVHFEDFFYDVRWINDQYAFLKVDGWNKDIFLHKNSFFFNEKEVCPLDADSISFDVVPGKLPDSLQAINVSEGFSVRLPPWFEGKLRFYVQLIWKFGRSLSDPDAPEELRHGARRFLDDVEWLKDYEDEEAFPWKIMTTLERATKLMHKDAPAYLWDAMEAHLEENKWSAWEIGYALGSLDTERQRDMFNNVIHEGMQGNGTAFAILGTALWRVRHLVHRLFPDQVRGVANGLLKFLHKSLKKLKTQQIPLDKKKFREINYEFKNICETFLALLRCRESDNSEIAALLDSNGKLAEEFRTEFESLVLAQQEFGFNMKSFLKLELPEGDTKIPDILRAADLYLNGDAGASDIRIVAICEEEE